MNISKRTDFEDVLYLWASKDMTAKEAAKELAHKTEQARYHNRPVFSLLDNNRAVEYFCSLLRELSRG